MQKVDYINACMTMLESVKQSLKEKDSRNWEKQHTDGSIKNRLKMVRDLTLRLEKELNK